MKVNVKDIDSNPYRNFDKYPIDQDHVDMLKATISRSGMWNNLEARKGENGSYQLAYGHHRIEAAKQLGMESINLNIVKLGEDGMIDRMVTENTTQRGYTTPAIYDSVRAIMKRLAYILLANDADSLSTNVDKHLFKKEGSFEKCKGRMQSGEGMGERIIRRYNDSLSLREIRDAIAAMKSTGEVKALMKEVTEQISFSLNQIQ